MKFSVKREDALKCFGKLISISERSNIIPILSNVLIETGDNCLNVYATNLAVSLIDICPAEIESNGKITLETRKLVDILKVVSSEDVLFESNDDNSTVKIVCGKTKYTLAVLNAEEYPAKPEIKESNAFIISKSKLFSMINKIDFALIGSENRTVLDAVFMEVNKNEKSALRLVATDAHRLSCIDRIEEDNERFEATLDKFLLSNRGTVELKRLISTGTDLIHLWIDNNNLFVKDNNTILIIRMIERDFPNYKKAMTIECKCKVKFNTKETISALKRISVILDEQSKSITLNFSNGVLLISAKESSQQGEETIEVDYSDEQRSINFNMNYILDSLNCIEDDNFIFEFTDEKLPVKILPEKDINHVMIVMPMVY